MATIEKRIERAREQWRAWEAIGKNLADDHADIGADKGLSQTELDELSQSRADMEKAIQDYHTKAHALSGGGPK